MDMKKKLSLILIALFVSLIAIAQNRTIKGILVDAESGDITASPSRETTEECISKTECAGEL